MITIGSTLHADVPRQRLPIASVAYPEAMRRRWLAVVLDCVGAVLLTWCRC